MYLNIMSVQLDKVTLQTAHSLLLTNLFQWHKSYDGNNIIITKTRHEHLAATLQRVYNMLNTDLPYGYCIVT